MKFLEEFVKNYIRCHNNDRKCIICNKSTKFSENHGTLYCRFDSKIHFDVYSSKIIIIINEHANTAITLYFDRFCFTIKDEFISILYDKEFNDFFELKDYCLDTYNRYKKNLIFF